MSLAEVEIIIGQNLPNDFKEYITNNGNGILEPSCSFPMKEFTPFGNKAMVDSIFLPDIETLKEDDFFELGMICVGSNVFGNGIYLSFRQSDYGSVYYWDHEYRCLWDDGTFYSMFPNLAEEIVNYLELRRKGETPVKETDFESFYLAAKSFSEFINALEPEDY